VPGPLRIDRPEDGVAVLTLALPERRNAMTDELTAAWSGALADLRADA
jgi:enoyl-CoA hydratase/carnithine racemase